MEEDGRCLAGGKVVWVLGSFGTEEGQGRGKRDEKCVRESGRRKVRRMEGKDRRRERRTVHKCTKSGRGRIRGRKMKHGVKRGGGREGKVGLSR